MIMIRRSEVRDPDSPARFGRGTLVRHRRYGYRGVVVEVDQECRASTGWYAANQTQPIRDQPWYHVLVHDAHHSTYAAEDNLVSDESTAAVLHPLVPLYFGAFSDGRYVRNERPWGQA